MILAAAGSTHRYWTIRTIEDDRELAEIKPRRVGTELRLEGLDVP